MSILHEHFRKFKKTISKKTHIDKFVEKSILLNAHSRKVIVFPEIDTIILKACSVILRDGIAIPLIIGEKAELIALLSKLGIHNIKDQHILDHLEDKNKMQ